MNYYLKDMLIAGGILFAVFNAGAAVGYLKGRKDEENVQERLHDAKLRHMMMDGLIDDDEYERICKEKASKLKNNH